MTKCSRRERLIERKKSEGVKSPFSGVVEQTGGTFKAASRSLLFSWVSRLWASVPGSQVGGVGERREGAHGRQL